ncbi:MAG: SRPBCC family protein [Actinomycetota bacterium]|nr:SRPBCC family protein [Actinomycetota bacterium]
MSSAAPPTDPPSRLVSASRLIHAPASAIFDLLADPARHAEIDGSGTVQNQRMAGPRRLSLHATFGMDMKMFGLPYRITNVVVEFEENRRIAWRHFGRHIWRYVLEPTGPGDNDTLVTESFDWGSSVVPRLYELVGYPSAHEVNMAKTLQRLDSVVTGEPDHR